MIGCDGHAVTDSILIAISPDCKDGVVFVVLGKWKWKCMSISNGERRKGDEDEDGSGELLTILTSAKGSILIIIII